MTASVKADEPAWLRIFRKEIGVREIIGGPNERIGQYIASVHGEPGDDWCSAAMNWVMEQAGIKGTGSRAARSWQHWGEKLDEPRLGCVAVLWRESKQSWKGHVALWLATRGDHLELLGANQNRSVCIKLYPAERLLSYRWPLGVTEV
jgi:uncharacterized protein (TIGR02594 family)